MIVNINQKVDACVIGAGAGGSVSARHLNDSGLDVVLLEAGKRFDINTEYSDLPSDMLLKKFAWPTERKADPLMVDDNGNPLTLEDSHGNPILGINEFGKINNAWGLGGTTQMYFANHPRSHYRALDEWDTFAPLNNGQKWRYELNPYYDWLEKELPVPNAPMGYGPFDNHNAILLVGANNYAGIVPGDIDDNVQTSIPMYDAREADPAFTDGGTEQGGYRGHPNAIHQHCWHCGNCWTGCDRAKKTQLKDKVRRATNVSMIPQAEQRGLKVIPQSFVMAVLHASNPNFPNIVIYGVYSLDAQGLPQTNQDGQLIIDSISVQPTHTVVFSASTIESPNIWLRSNYLLNDAASQGLLQNILLELAKAFAIEQGLDPNDPNAIAQLISQLSSIYIQQAQNGQLYTLPLNDNVGRHFMTHDENFVVALYDKPIDSNVGQGSQTRVDLPGLGMIESAGFRPMAFSLIANAKDIRYVIDQQTGQFVLDNDGNPIVEPTQSTINLLTGQPIPDEYYPNYIHPSPTFGVEAKELSKKFRHMVALVALSEDTPEPYNRVKLDPVKKELFYLAGFGTIGVPVTTVQHHPSKTTQIKNRKIIKMIMECFKHVEDTSELKLEKIVNLPLQLSSVFHSMGTMSMGKVVDANCEAIGADRIFVADASVLPNTLDGPNPVHTIQALALRTSEALVNKYFPEKFANWATKIGGTF